MLRSSLDRIEVDADGQTRVVAERSRGRWSVTARLDAATTELVRTVLAVDVDLAVQGSSIVFDASAYAPCTTECQVAAACDAPAKNDRCAASLVTCGACLEQEP